MIFSLVLLIMVTAVPGQLQAQRQGRGIPDLTEEQRVELRKLKDEHFMERNRMADRMRNDRMGMRKRYDERLRSILSEKQYYAFRQRGKDKAMKRKGLGRKHGRFHRGQRAF